MARALQNVSVYIPTDKDGVPLAGEILWTYDVVDGAAKKSAASIDVSPDFSKTMHNTGAVGEFWRDGVDVIKTAENI